MGIKTEYNPDLALRSMEEFRSGRRLVEECIPENLKPGSVCEFLKEGQRVFWLEGEVPLVETKGSQQLSRPVASIVILESTHFMKDGKPYTKGKYRVIEAFNDDRIYFEGFHRKK